MTALAEVLSRSLGPDADVAVRAYDGSSAGPPDAPAVFHIRNPRALAYLIDSPGQLGLARAYVNGDLEVEGDVHHALSTLSEARWLGARDALEVLWRAVGHLREGLKPPPEEIRLSGRRHSRARDAQAIAHHYDVSNRFYELLLGPSMAYTCAVYPQADASLEEAQWTKHELVARKLGLEPGMRLLDVGCGWGGMVLHAAREHGVKVIGVTLSRQQAEWGAKKVSEAGLSHLAEVRHGDYRDIAETGFDAISSIGLTEHIGRAQLGNYFTRLYRKLKPGGRLLNHCITRPSNREPAVLKRGFIARYIFPDGELSGPGHLVSQMHDHDFEVRHLENLREHYAMTLAAWSGNLEAHWDEAVTQAGERRARVWRLYLAGSRVAFDRNGIELHQILGVRLDGFHARMPLRPDW